MNELTASPGDRLIIKAHRVGEHDREGEIIETRGANGRPPFIVRWDDTGKTGLLYPGSDAVVRRYAHHS